MAVRAMGRNRKIKRRDNARSSMNMKREMWQYLMLAAIPVKNTSSQPRKARHKLCDAAQGNAAQKGKSELVEAQDDLIFWKVDWVFHEPSEDEHARVKRQEWKKMTNCVQEDIPLHNVLRSLLEKDPVSKHRLRAIFSAQEE